MQEDIKEKRYIYGPVPSRRLGFSLGVDLVPYKVCTYDCIYCQLGKTIKKTIQRKEYIERREILLQIGKALLTKQKIDFITFSGSGEPTLNTGIGFLIRETKRLTNIPVAVITNGSLLYNEKVRKSLLEADLVVPSLDAARERTFKFINRPPSSLKFDNIVRGLLEFRKEFRGKIWLEIMLVKDVNNSAEEVKLFESIIGKAAFDRIQLNTVVRPPCVISTLPLGIQELRKIKNIFGEKCEIVSDFKKELQKTTFRKNAERILEMIKRRPVTVQDISASLGLNRNEVVKYLDIFRKNGKIKILNFKGKHYYGAR